MSFNSFMKHSGVEILSKCILLLHRRPGSVFAIHGTLYNLSYKLPDK